MTQDYIVLETDENGYETRQYADGSIRYRGKLRTLPPKLREEIQKNSSERAVERHKMRKERILRAIEEQITDLTRTNVPEEAIAAIVRKRAQIALTDDTRTGNEAAKLVLQVIDAYQDKVDENRTSVLRHEYSMDKDTIELFDRLTRMKRDADIIDVDSTDV